MRNKFKNEKPFCWRVWLKQKNLSWRDRGGGEADNGSRRTYPRRWAEPNGSFWATCLFGTRIHPRPEVVRIWFVTSTCTSAPQGISGTGRQRWTEASRWSVCASPAVGSTKPATDNRMRYILIGRLCWGRVVKL